MINMSQFEGLHVFPYHLLDEVISISDCNVLPGELLADLSRFPPQVYIISPSGFQENITTNFLEPVNYWNRIRDWLVQFTDKTGLQDILSTKGYGFWWTLNAQKFVPSITETGNIFSWIDLLIAIRDQGQPEKIILHGKNDQLILVLKQIFSGIEIVIPEETSKRGMSVLWKEKISRPAGLLLVRVLHGILYLLFSWIHPPDIIFLTNTNLLRLSRVKGKTNYTDVYLGEIASSLQNEGWRVLMVEKFGTLGSWKRFFSRPNTFFSDVLYLLSHPKLAKLGFHRKIVKRWQQRWIEVKDKLVNFMKYQGVDISQLVLPIVESQFLKDAPDLEVLTMIWRQLLKIWKPKLIIVNDGYGKAAIPVVIAAKLEGVITVEQQHGVIGRGHFAYLVPRQIITETNFPLCDFMIVWGNHFKSFLVNSDVFQDSQVVVCGSPRIDGLLNKSTSDIKIRNELVIKKGIPIVLYASNSVALDWMDELLDGIQKAEQTDDIYWLIKIHPRERTKQIWTNKIKQRHIKNIQVLGGDFDFYTLLRACDIHVSFSSTTLIEAAVLGKPNLGLDVHGIVDPPGFAQANAFLPVAPIDLGSTVELLLSDSILIKNLVADQKKFAIDWCLHDGNAVKRIVGFIESVINSHTIKEP